jgi:hypothetical protein
MSGKTIDSEKRWQGYLDFCDSQFTDIFTRELPIGVQSLITVVQEHFDEIRQEQAKYQLDSDSLVGYEAQLVLVLAGLEEGFNFLVIREILEGLFDKVLSADRIVSIDAGGSILSKEQKIEFKKTLQQITELSQDE